MKKMHVKSGDIVTVISGNHRGSQGKVLRVLREKDQVFVEGVRIIKKHMGRSPERPQGAIIEREGPIHISNVKLLEKSKKAAGASEPKTAKKAKVSKNQETKKKVKDTKASTSNQEEKEV